MKKLIRITDNKIFLTPEMYLDLSQTSLVGAHLSFRTVQDIYFEVEVLDYDKISNAISFDVTDYQPLNIDSFNMQIPKGKVSFIYFKPLKWQQIEKHLSIYTKKALIKEKIIIDDQPPAEVYTNNSFSGLLKRNGENHTGHKPLDPIVEKITEEAKIYFKDVDFNLGHVSFSYKSKRLNETYNLKIENHFLLAEFNAIKSYFPKVFGGKKQFSINVIFTRTNFIVTEILTKSVEIESINESLLDSIKKERVKILTSPPLRKSADKLLFTAEDIFDSFDEKLKDGNVFKQSGEDILNFLIETRNIRNAKQLQFLSGSKHSIKQKLHFTLNPLFGFLFFIEGETKNHFCWELLESHATYLWSFDKTETDVKNQFKKVEHIINIIRETGRDNYKKDYKTNKVNNEITFDSIEHSSINSASKDGFVEWQHKLNERLV